ncbi:MAG: Dabb family protein [Clostridiales bacterium]|nr:Dabb family protein [Clostridiales bacterium]
MVKHVVCFKLNEGESFEEAKKVLLSMDGNVPMLRGIEVGIDELRSARSYDVMLTVLLDDMNALAEYQKDPYHVSVVKKHMHAVTKTSISMDYTL